MTIFARIASPFRKLWFSALVLVFLAAATAVKLYHASSVRREAAQLPAETATKQPSAAPAAQQKPQPAKTITREFGEKMANFILPPENVHKEPVGPPPIPEEVKKQFVSAPSPISLFPVRAPVSKQPAAVPPIFYLPSFRTIRCQLVTAPETGGVESPLIGIVLEDQFNIDGDGVSRLVIPAGVEVHGMSKPSPSRDRIDGNGRWTFVWRTRDENNSMELAIDALALNRDYDAENGVLGDKEKAPGIKGEVFETYTEGLIRKALLASLAALPERLKSYNEPLNPLTGQTTLQERPTVANAAIGSLGAGLDSISTTLSKIRDQIDKDGYYLAILPGKEFYLYTKEPIDLRRGKRPQPIVAAATEPVDRKAAN